MASRARKITLRCVVVVATTFGTVWLASCDGPEETPPVGENTPPAAPANPELPPFRFDVGGRELVETVRGRLSDRERRAVGEAVDRVETAVTDLYVGAYLDPEHWTSGTYEDVFDVFAGVARPEAQRRAGILTAGEDAAERFDRIEPLRGRLSFRILLDRGSNPALVASKVRFVARGVGADPLTMESEGTFFFRRIDGAWRIVSFDVVRRDREGGTA